MSCRRHYFRWDSRDGRGAGYDSLRCADVWRIDPVDLADFLRHTMIDEAVAR